MKRAAYTYEEYSYDHPAHGKTGAAGSGFAAGGIILVIALSARPHTINLEELVEVSFSGFDTVGSAYAKLDQERFGAALAKAMGKKNVEGWSRVCS